MTKSIRFKVSDPGANLTWKRSFVVEDKFEVVTMDRLIEKLMLELSYSGKTKKKG